MEVANVNALLLRQMFPAQIEVGDEIDYSKLCPPVGSRIAFDDLPAPLRNNLRGLLIHHLNQVILIQESSGDLPFTIKVNGTQVHPDDLRGPKDVLCHLFQAAWLATWLNERVSSDNCSVCNSIVSQHRCSNLDCKTHIMTNDIFDPVERELKRTGTDG